jgi:hypothetical protein
MFRRFTSSSTLISSSSTLRHKSYVLKFVRGHLPNDLKDLQGAVGCLYGPLPDADEYGQFKMPKSHLDMYHQLGYVSMPHPVLSPEMVDCLADEVSQLADDKEQHPRTDCLYGTSLHDLSHDSKQIFYCQGQWRAAWGMHDLAIMPHLCVPCSQMLGDVSVRLWYDEVLMKGPRKGPCLPWMQNYTRWQHIKPNQNFVTVMVALDALTKDRGAPILIPGSHRWRGGDQIIPMPDFDPKKDEAAQLNSIWDVVTEDEKECLMDLPPITVELQRGQAMFIHPMTLYATHGNRSYDSSKVVFIHFMGNPTFAAYGGALLPKSTRFAPGSIIQGPYYPVAFDPSMVEDFSEHAQLPEGTTTIVTIRCS